MTQQLILIRGLPGAGKTTHALKLLETMDARHLEPDMFFQQDGEYCFDGNRLKEAHAWCQDQCGKALEKGQSVIVANTFAKHWELAPYRALAQQYGVALEILTARGTYPNIHGVPEQTLEKMRRGWQAVDDELFIDQEG